MKFLSANSLKRILIVHLAMAFVGPPWYAAEKIIGAKASEWTVGNWINSSPLKLNDLKGKIVLVRWWTAPDCPYCKATAPALNEFHERYAQQGLQVIGFYHHKSHEPFQPATVNKFASDFGFKFPVAIDHEWKTLRDWWLDKDKNNWTSVTFLIDRQGLIRHLHPGGDYVKGDKDYKLMKRKIENLLAEK